MAQTLTRAHDELFRRHPDEQFNTMQGLFEFYQARKERSELLWRPADDLQAIAKNGRLELATTPIDSHRMKSWSFGKCLSVRPCAST